MRVGTLTMALTWLLLGQALQVAQAQQGDVLISNQRLLRVPINFKDSLRNNLRDLLLFASWDQGRTYQQVAKVAPDKNEFVFEATNDGVCWLKVAVIDRQGKQIPDNIQQGRPDSIIVIDTMKPVLRVFTAQRQGDEVVVTWEILEDHFDPQGFKLEYSAKDSPSSFWTNVGATAALTGKKTFRPSSGGPLTVRLMVKDLGGNQSEQRADVAGNGVALASFNPPPAPTPMPSNLGADLPPPMPPPTPENIGANPRTPTPPVPVDTVKQPLMPNNNNWAPTPGINNEPKDERVVATTQIPAPTPPPSVPVANNATVPPTPPTPPRRQLPTVKFVNHPIFIMEYNLRNVGKSGIGSVELYRTQNDGQTWDLYAVDEDVKGSTQNGPQTRELELPGQGVYGFILVVKSRAGLGKPAPRPGDIPEIRVEVDTTAPDAKLYAPTPDPINADALLLRWSATDKNLPLSPITLEWSEKRDGVWTPIVTDHANTGQYRWPVPPGLPVQVYMRLRVKDLAGNESTAVTQEPQLVDLSVPEAELIGIVPTTRRP